MSYLVLTRRVGETLVIGENVQVTVFGVKGHYVRLGVTAPRDVEVDRQEIRERKRANPATSTEDIFIDGVGAGRRAILRESEAQVPVAATLDDAAADPALTLDVARELLRDAAAGIRSLAASAERTEPCFDERRHREREQRDEALLRQALEALERGAWDALRGRNAAAAIRERLEEKA